MMVAAADLPTWLAGQGLSTLITAQAPAGLIRWQLDDLAVRLAAGGAQLIEQRRAWDDLLWPRATAGFFKLKTSLPAVIARLVPDLAQPRLLSAIQPGQGRAGSRDRGKAIRPCG
jgi:deoxyribodipyrimidine photo-lyase